MPAVHDRPINPDLAVDTGAFVEARTVQGAPHDHGKVVSYSIAPTFTIERPDGTHFSWRADMTYPAAPPAPTLDGLCWAWQQINAGNRMLRRDWCLLPGDHHEEHRFEPFPLPPLPRYDPATGGLELDVLGVRRTVKADAGNALTVVLRLNEGPWLVYEPGIARLGKPGEWHGPLISEAEIAQVKSAGGADRG